VLILPFLANRTRMRDESDRGSLRPLVTAFLGEADPGTGRQPVEIGADQAVPMKI
jgi:hypothetical protein